MATERQCGLASGKDDVLIGIWVLTDAEQPLVLTELADAVCGRARRARKQPSMSGERQRGIECYLKPWFSRIQIKAQSFIDILRDSAPVLLKR